MTLALGLGIVAALVVAASSWQDRRRGIFLVALLLPTYLLRFDLFGIPFTVLEVMILTLFATFCLRDWKTIMAAGQRLLRRKSRRGIEKNPWSGAAGYLVVLLLIASIYSVIVTPDLQAGAGIWKAYILEPILFFIVFRHAMKDRRDLAKVFAALAGSAGLVALLALVQFATGWGIPEPWQAWPGRRATSLYGFPNAVGLFVAPILTLVLGLQLYWRPLTRQARVGLGLFALLLLGALVAARVEGALVAVTAGSVVLLFFTRFRYWVLAVAGAVAVAAFTYPATREILLFADTSGDVRLALWRGTWNLLQAQPIFGAGLGAFPMVYDIYRLPSHVELLQYPHNIFLDFWVELGLLGLVWVVSAVVIWLAASWQAHRRGERLGLVLLGVLVTVLVYGLVDVPYFKNDLAVLFWLWLAAALVLVRRRA